MLKKGQRVQVLTKKAGQTPRTGIVTDLRQEEFVEVEWEDGRTSTVTASSLVPAPSEKRRK